MKIQWEKVHVQRGRGWQGPKEACSVTGNLKGGSESGVPAGDLMWPGARRCPAHVNSLSKVSRASALRAGESELSEAGAGDCSQGPGAAEADRVMM